MNPPNKILIVRLSAIGDVVMASALIKAFKRRYPLARLSWLVDAPAKGLLASNPDLDEVIVLPLAEWGRLWRARRYGEWWRAWRRFSNELRARGFDLVIDAQGLLKSGVWAWLSRAPTRVGLGSKEGSQYLMTRVVSRDLEDDRIGVEYYHLAQELGLDLTEYGMDLALSADDDAYAQGFAAEHGRYAVICPFTTRPQKHWREERWPLLAGVLAAEHTLKVVMLGGPGDVEAAARIQAAHPAIINLAGRCSLTQSAALIKHAALLVGVDTGLTHMGIAFAVPTVALFGSTCPYLNTTRANARVIYHRLECSPCRRSPTCAGDFTCMKNIEVAEVMQTVAQVMPLAGVRP